MARYDSILAADFGSVHTRVVLIDVVDGVYRLVARGRSRTTEDFPANDITVGFERAVRRISETTGRRLISDTGQVISPEQGDGSGVDLFALTASIGRPLRVVVVGLMADVSLASAVRATEGAYIDVMEAIHLEDGRDEEARLNAILLNHPDLIVITGGTEGGAKTAVLTLARIAQLAVQLTAARQRPPILYTGNQALAEDIQVMFEPLTTVLLADNVRPALADEHLEPARTRLGQAFDRYKERQGQDFAAIGGMSRTGMLPTAQGYRLVAEYLYETFGEGVALLDVGSGASTLAAGLNGAVTASIRTDIGLGHSAPALLDAVGVEAVRRWLPFFITAAELRNYTLNKSLRPATIPATLRELHIEHALLKAGVQAIVSGAHPEWNAEPLPFRRVITAGAALTHTGRPGLNALLALDALQPDGIARLDSDPHALIAAMGAMAPYAPEVVVHLLEASLTGLGTTISVQGKPRPDRPAMRVRITEADGRQVDHVVDGGHLWVYPLDAGQEVRVRVRCSRGLTVNGRGRLEFTATGGSAGLIFDARGRPLPLALDAAGRAEQIPLWIAEVTGDEVRPIDPAWLEGVEETPETPARRQPTRRRRGRRTKQEAAAERSEDDLSDLDDLLKDEDEDELDELRNVLS